MYDSFNHTHHCSDTLSYWRPAELATQQELGLRAKRWLGDNSCYPYCTDAYGLYIGRWLA